MKSSRRLATAITVLVAIPSAVVRRSLTVNGGDGNMVETTPQGTQVAVRTVDNDSGGAGNLFGLAVKPGADVKYFVDDLGSDNNLQLLF